MKRVGPLRRHTRRFIAYDRRHRWRLVREYAHVELRVCTACGRWTRTHYGALGRATRRAFLPALIEATRASRPLLQALTRPLALSGGSVSIRVPGSR